MRRYSNRGSWYISVLLCIDSAISFPITGDDKKQTIMQNFNYAKTMRIRKSTPWTRIDPATVCLPGKYFACQRIFARLARIASPVTRNSSGFIQNNGNHHKTFISCDFKFILFFHYPTDRHSQPHNLQQQPDQMWYRRHHRNLTKVSARNWCQISLNPWLTRFLDSVKMLMNCAPRFVSRIYLFTQNKLLKNLVNGTGRLTSNSITLRDVNFCCWKLTLLRLIRGDQQQNACLGSKLWTSIFR